MFTYSDIQPQTMTTTDERHTVLQGPANCTDMWKEWAAHCRCTNKNEEVMH